MCRSEFLCKLIGELRPGLELGEFDVLRGCCTCWRHGGSGHGLDVCALIPMLDVSSLTATTDSSSLNSLNFIGSRYITHSDCFVWKCSRLHLAILHRCSCLRSCSRYHHSCLYVLPAHWPKVRCQKVLWLHIEPSPWNSNLCFQHKCPYNEDPHILHQHRYINQVGF